MILTIKQEVFFLNYDPIVDYENTYIKPSVRIEIGVREAWTPNESISLNSFIGTVNKENENFQDGWSFKVNVIKPERTFWEKVNILQQESNRDESKDLPERYSRQSAAAYFSFSLRTLSVSMLLSFFRIPVNESVR